MSDEEDDRRRRIIIRTAMEFSMLSDDERRTLKDIDTANSSCQEGPLSPGEKARLGHVMVKILSPPE